MTIDETADWAPEACTLPSAERPLRVAEFDALFQESVLSWTRNGDTRLELSLRAEAEATARDLAGRESGCCSFFTFGFEQGPLGVVMSIEVPGYQIAVLDALSIRVAAVRGGGTQ